jgi:hypothetical protein
MAILSIQPVSLSLDFIAPKARETDGKVFPGVEYLKHRPRHSWGLPDSVAFAHGSPSGWIIPQGQTGDWDPRRRPFAVLMLGASFIYLSVLEWNSMQV